MNKRIACNNAAGKWLFQNKKFDIIDNGILLEDYHYNQNDRAEIRKDFKLNKSDILLGNVGKFNYQKNQSFLLDILKQLPEKYKLMLVGNGPDFKDVLLKANVLNLSDRVIFTGVVNDVQRYLSAMDAFVLPSRFEGQPFVVIEAAANGLPVILSDHVSEEINITNSFTFLPLEIDTWVEQLKKLKLKDRIYETTINTVALRKNGYDLADNVENLLKLYTDNN